MRRSVLIGMKIAAFTPLLLLVVLTNYLIDPAHLFFNKNVEQTVARLSFQGRTVTARTIGDFDDRYYLRSYLRLLDKPRDVYVFGSSRTMYFSPGFFPGKTFLNMSVSDAGINDFLGLYGFIYQKGWIPSTLVIGVDPWIFSQHWTFVHKRWESLQDSYNFMTAVINKGRDSFNITDRIPVRLLELFSFSYFQTSLFYLWHRHSDKLVMKAQWDVTDQLYNKYNTLWPDGTTTPWREHLEFNSQQVDETVRTQINQEKDWFQADPQLKQKFENFIFFIRQKGSRVVFFLPPYHPVAFAAFNGGLSGEHANREQGQAGNFDNIEKYVRDVAQRNKIPVCGSYDPNRLGLTAAQFMDDKHLKTMEDTRQIFLNCLL